jgi:hypothetical protein
VEDAIDEQRAAGLVELILHRLAADGTSMMTLRLCGGFSPTGIKSIRISDLAWLAPRPVSAGLQQLVEASLSRGRLHEVRIAKPAMIVDGDFAVAIAALHEQLDRVLRALGVLDCLLPSPV